jgi:hypothetical protein
MVVRHHRRHRVVHHMAMGHPMHPMHAAAGGDIANQLNAQELQRIESHQ